MEISQVYQMSSVTDTVSISCEEDIVYLTVLENAVFSFESSLEIRRVMSDMLGDRKMPVLIDARKNFFVTNEGMDLAVTDVGMKNRSAIAYIADNLPSKLKLKVFLGTRKPTVPSKIFGNREEAIEWLKQFS